MTARDTYGVALNLLDAIRIRREDREHAGTYDPSGESEQADARVWAAHHDFYPGLGSTLLYALEERAAEEAIYTERTL